MLKAPIEADWFRPSQFFERARLRLRSPDDAEAAAVTAILNPDFIPPKNFAPRDAAVLIPVIEREMATTVLLTRRTAHLRKHAGQIAFPGGKIDATDSGPVAAALREAQEEIGLDPALVEPIGCLDPFLAGTGYRITGVVACIATEPRLVLNPDEVDAAFEVPLSFLMTPENHRQNSREWQDGRHFFYEMPYDEHYIWGVTAGIIRGLYERLFE